MTAIPPLDSIPCVYGPRPSRPPTPIDLGEPPAPRTLPRMSKGEELAVSCFVAGLHEANPSRAAAALLELIDYIRTLENGAKRA